ncbi:hypothetical protein HanPI659440_Chr17g0672401 [Helianthus annuus]|nr:hypothetical protein HanPI659440_Chr17g0672401 [Helianthus annuus]
MFLGQNNKICSNEKNGKLGKNRIEDIRWLCALSNSELNILISLRKMPTRRQSSILKKKGARKASVIKHKSLSKKFDLKMLKDLSFVLMQGVKERLVDVPQMARLHLAKYEISEEVWEMGVEELMAYIHPDKRKRISKLFGIDDSVRRKKRRLSSGKKTITID